MSVQLICDRCGNSFERDRPSKAKHVFCSTGCYYAFAKIGQVIACPTCGKMIYRNPSQLAQGRRHCSKACYDIARAAKMISKVCPICGKTFEVKASIADRYTVCSIECRHANVKRQACKRCGKTFTVSEKRYGRHYCSEECRRPPVFINCRNCRKEFRTLPADTDRQFCCFACYRSFQGETLLEKVIRETLDCLDIEYIQEAGIGRYSVDFLLPGARIALEVDGEYWHQDRERDTRKTRYLMNHGWKVCRIAESKIENAPDLGDLVIRELQRVTDLEITPLQPRLL